MNRPSGDKQPTNTLYRPQPIHFAEINNDPNRCDHCKIILALAEPDHDCMRIKSKEVEWGKSWSINDQF